MWETIEYKVGDKVIVKGSGTAVVCEVVRITPKGFVIVKPLGSNGNYTYTFKPNGFERTSDPWDKRTIHPLTQGDIDLINVSKARREAKRQFERCYAVLTKEQAEAIIGLLEGVEVRENV